VTEDEVRFAVCLLATQHELLWHWCGSSRRCKGARGLPDLIIAGPGGHLLAELKGDGGEESPGQQLWHWMLHQSTAPRCPYRLWGPGQLLDQTVARHLAALAAPSQLSAPLPPCARLLSS
jgi:hypothetical protein